MAPFVEQSIEKALRKRTFSLIWTVLFAQPAFVSGGSFWLVEKDGGAALVHLSILGPQKVSASGRWFSLFSLESGRSLFDF